MNQEADSKARDQAVDGADEELIDWAEDSSAAEGAQEGTSKPPWRVLVVDDEEDVHAATRIALSDSDVLGRPLQLIHAYSAREGCEILTRERDIAVVLLDVVMEEADSGLKLIKVIRDQLGLDQVRIILRTGQPGYAPELDAVRDYDINDYKAKAELTRNKLSASLTSAIRSYQQIHSLDASRKGLLMILEASSRLMALQGLSDFAAGVITQLAGLMRVAPEGLVCAQASREAQPGSDAAVQVCRVVAAAGQYRELINQPLTAVDDRICQALQECFEQRKSVFHDNSTALYFPSATGSESMAVFLDLVGPVDESNRELLNMFCHSIAACVDNVRVYDRLNVSAFQDALCRVLNRVAMIGAIDKMFADGTAHGKLLVVADIDGFSEINNSFGHAYGDRLLRAYADRLIGLWGGSAVVARLSGDTFALLGDDDVLEPASVCARLNEPLQLDARKVVLRTTLGLVKLAEGKGNGADLLNDAAIAMRSAKQRHRGNYQFFSTEMAEDINQRVKLLGNLREALDRERLTVVFQPQFELGARRTVGLEALLRWRTDEGEYVEPERFVPLAERSGMSVALGEWVLRTACVAGRRLAMQGNPMRISVNLSLAQFRDPCFLVSLDDALADSGLDPATLEIEITESLAMQDMDFTISQLNQVKRRKVTVALDDFGTGYSSLSYLYQLPVDRIKIDRSFVEGLNEENHRRSIAAGVVELARQIGARVLAEGIETETQLECLRKLGVEEGQGWLVGKGMPETELGDWLKANGTMGAKA